MVWLTNTTATSSRRAFAAYSHRWVVVLSWQGAVTAFFWAALVRVSLLHHVTFSINSICHMVGDRPFDSGDKAANFWPLAILSFGESWHNSHHTDPSCARHGVLKGQIDITARLIWIFEKLGWAWNVKWPRMDKFDSSVWHPPRPFSTKPGERRGGYMPFSLTPSSLSLFFAAGVTRRRLCDG